MIGGFFRSFGPLGVGYGVLLFGRACRSLRNEEDVLFDGRRLLRKAAAEMRHDRASPVSFE